MQILALGGSSSYKFDYSKKGQTTIPPPPSLTITSCFAGPVSPEQSCRASLHDGPPAQGIVCCCFDKLILELSSAGINGYDTTANPVSYTFMGFSNTPGPNGTYGFALGATSVVQEGNTLAVNVTVGQQYCGAERIVYAELRGFTGGVNHYAWAEVDIIRTGSGTFTVAASPPSQTLTSPGTVGFPIAVNAAWGFSSSVSLSFSGLPGGTTAYFVPGNGSQTSFTVFGGNPGYATLVVTTTSSTPAGTYPLKITASGGGVTATAGVSLTIGQSTMQQQTITSSPAGLSLTVDNASCSAPCSFSWLAGTSHTILAPTSLTDTQGNLIIFTQWSDGGTVMHPITAGGAPASVNASFRGTTTRAARRSTSPTYYVLNDGNPVTWAYQLFFEYCDTDYNCAWYPADASGTTELDVSKAGVSATFAGSPSAQAPSDPSTFDVSFTANSSVIPGSADLTVLDFGTSFPCKQRRDDVRRHARNNGHHAVCAELAGWPIHCSDRGNKFWSGWLRNRVCPAFQHRPVFPNRGFPDHPDRKLGRQRRLRHAFATGNSLRAVLRPGEIAGRDRRGLRAATGDFNGYERLRGGPRGLRIVHHRRDSKLSLQR